MRLRYIKEEIATLKIGCPRLVVHSEIRSSSLVALTSVQRKRRASHKAKMREKRNETLMQSCDYDSM